MAQQESSHTNHVWPLVCAERGLRPLLVLLSSCQLLIAHLQQLKSSDTDCPQLGVECKRQLVELHSESNELEGAGLLLPTLRKHQPCRCILVVPRCCLCISANASPIVPFPAL